LRGRQGIDNGDGRGEEDRVSFDASGMAKGNGDVRFAESNCADAHNVGVIGDEGQAEQVLDLRAINLPARSVGSRREF